MADKLEKCPAGRWQPGAHKQTACFQCIHADKFRIMKHWGEHCNFKPTTVGKQDEAKKQSMVEKIEKEPPLHCYVCGSLLPEGYLQQIKGRNHYITMRLREQTKSGICEKCIKKRNKVLDDMKKTRGRYLWQVSVLS